MSICEVLEVGIIGNLEYEMYEILILVWQDSIQ